MIDAGLAGLRGVHEREMQPSDRSINKITDPMERTVS